MVLYGIFVDTAAETRVFWYDLRGLTLSGAQFTWAVRKHRGVRQRGWGPRLWKSHAESFCGGTSFHRPSRFDPNGNHDSSMRTIRHNGMRERPINTCGGWRDIGQSRRAG